MAFGPLGLRLEERLGHGASSEVWRARTAAGELVAVKMGHGPSHAQRLADEGERLTLVESSALARLLGAGFVPSGGAGAGPAMHAGRPYLVLELAPGKALDPTAKCSRAERLSTSLAVARDVAEALADLHAVGMAHGDVKPANIVVEREANRGTRARLVDLDLGVAADEELVRSGTRRYLAPEALTSIEVGDARARDLWAFGATLAEMASPKIAASRDLVGALASAPLPEELEPIIVALTNPAPGARPSAAWVRRRISDLIGEAESEEVRVERARRSVVRAYLGTRRREILQAALRSNAQVNVDGIAGQWLERALHVARQVARLRGSAVDGPPARLEELGVGARALWLVALVGPSAARWPAFPLGSDAQLAERLLALAESCDPSAFTLGALEELREARRELPSDPIEIAHAIGTGDVSPALLDSAERLALSGSAPPALAVAVGRALRLRGEVGRALALLGRLDGSAARVEAAETARRAGAVTEALVLLEGMERDVADSPSSSRRAATLARIQLERGESVIAAQTLAAASPSAATLEVRALIHLAEANRSAARRAVEHGLALATTEEERARLEAVKGGIAHAAGEVDVALVSFRRAVEHAVRAGAVLEEATYLTGLAAAATVVGDIAEALDAAARALLLFEHLGRPREAARAALSRAACFSQVGAVDEAREAAQDTMVRARASGDRRCRAYAHLCVADVTGTSDLEGLEHARRAWALLDGTDADDELRAAARLLARGDEVDVQRHDQWAGQGAAAADARLEWWGARASCESEQLRPERADALLAEINALVTAYAPLGVRGPALASGARLAARVAEADVARRLALAAREAARELSRRAPQELRSAVAALPWVSSVQAPAEVSVSGEQVGDVEALVHALGRRDRLRPLLDQVLDALILWTGVERGLLLLCAPGDRLVPRAARNIARADLVGEQLRLSTSLAERALASREPVVAVDAAGELPDLYTSVHALKLRSVLAVPLLARGEAFGVVYLDDRVRRGAFGPAELSWVRLVASLASVAIADARDQLLLKRAARRARRAEDRLAEELAHKQAALDVAERELMRSRAARDTRFRYEQIVGESEALGALLRLVDRVALSEVPVLVVGESGSGKELVARAIHDNGPRAARPFVGENCGAIPEPLLESALFGHVKGAFTGAARPRAGLFDVADGGTLFLDEIGEMSLGMQTKLLRVLEDGVVNAVGSDRGRSVDVRVIGATNRDLAALVREGRFRQDLLYRLDVISLRVPPLRERRGDIPLLVRHFLDKHGGEPRRQLTAAALDALTAFDWPGNVRQLENEVRRALVLSDEEIGIESLSPEVRSRGVGAKSLASELDLRARVDLLEGELVRTALDRTSGNQTRAAELLGLSRFGLQKMMKRLGIDVGAKPGRRSKSSVGKRR